MSTYVTFTDASCPTLLEIVFDLPDDGYVRVFEAVCACIWFDMPEDDLKGTNCIDPEYVELDRVVITNRLIDVETLREIVFRGFDYECGFLALNPEEIKARHSSLAGTKFEVQEDGTQKKVDVWTPGGWC